MNFADPLGLCGDSGGISDWYWNGMGGLSDWVDSNVMGGQANDLGGMQADYDSGLLSGLALAGGYASLGTRVIVTAGMTVVGGEVVIGAGQSVLAAAGAGAAAEEANFVATPNGTIVPIPDGWVGRVADSGKGLIYEDPSSAASVRIMDPVTTGTYPYPNGYARITNGVGDYLDSRGIPSKNPNTTHIPF